MKDFPPNHYERAFKNWLIDNSVPYIVVDEHKRAAFSRRKVKSFDFLVYSRSEQILIAEVKGRKFTGNSFAKMTGFECWVTTDDVNGLASWQQVFGPSHHAIFVFAYRIEKVDVDFDGRKVFDFDANRYVFFIVSLENYKRFMKPRSPKWRTLTLPADKFRKCAIEAGDFLL
jgi:hypothetical protein